MLVLKVPFERVQEDIRTRVKRAFVREKYLEVLPLVVEFFEKRNIAFSQKVVPRYYSIDKDLQIPFAPPLVIGVEGKLVLPWFVFWKDNPLAGENLSLFVTIVKEILEQDSDLADADFMIVDLSFDRNAGCRTMKVTDSREIPLLSEERKILMLKVFAEGFREAKRLSALQEQKKEHSIEVVDAAQIPLL